jgi:hypothetical protein
VLVAAPDDRQFLGTARDADQGRILLAVPPMVRSASFRQAFPQSLLDADLAARLCFAARLCVDAHIDLPKGTRFRVASCAGVGSPYNDYRIIGCPARYRALGVVWLDIAGPPHHLAYGAEREGAVVMDNGTYFRGNVDHCLLLDLSLLAGAVTSLLITHNMLFCIM